MATHVTLPQLASQLADGAYNCMAAIWKIVLAAKSPGRPGEACFRIHLCFQGCKIGMVLAYALPFVALMLLIEYLVIQLLVARAGAWRRLVKG